MKISKRYHKAFFEFVCLGGYPSVDAYFADHSELRELKKEDMEIAKFYKYRKN